MKIQSRQIETSWIDFGGDGAADLDPTYAAKQRLLEALLAESSDRKEQQRLPTPWPGRGRRRGSIISLPDSMSLAEASRQEYHSESKRELELEDRGIGKRGKRVRIEPFVSQAPLGASGVLHTP